MVYGMPISTIPERMFQPSEVIVGTGVGKNTSDRVPMLVQRIKGKQARCGWLIQLDKAGQMRQWFFIKASRFRQAMDGLEVTPMYNGKKYRLIVAPDAEEKLKVE